MKIREYYVDGGSKNNGKKGKQKASICVTDRDGKVLVRENIGDKTNNEAELEAILACVNLSKKPKKIYCDSELCVGLVKKTHQTKIDRLLKPLRQIWLHPAYIDIEWISREQNKAGHILEEKPSFYQMEVADRLPAI